MDALLADLARRGIQLWVDGDRLRYKTAHGAPAPEVLSRLQAHKQELITFLRNGQNTLRTHRPSFAQSRFYALQKLNPADAFYNVPFVFRLSGPVDPGILRTALNELVKRHEVLRTTLQETGGELQQVIAPTGEINMTVAELAADNPTDPGPALWNRLQSDMERPFDLARESGLRVLLLRTGADEYFLQLCFHNTLFDQNSLMVLLNELSVHYAALARGEKASLPAPAQYTEYVEWQASHLAAGMDGRLKYWREWFDRGAPPKWQWTPHKEPPATPGFDTHVPWQRCNSGLTRQLKALAQNSGGTLYLTLLTAYAIILSRYTGSDDITFGTTYSNRHHWRFASLIGATIDVPALRVEMSDNPTLLTLLARVRTVVAEALTWQDVPFDRIAPSLQPKRKATGPLFRMVFSYFAEVPHGRLQLPDIRVEFLEERVNRISRPDLYLVFWENHTETGEALTGYWMHKQDVFEAATAEKMNRELGLLLFAMVKSPTDTVKALLSSLG